MKKDGLTGGRKNGTTNRFCRRLSIPPKKERYEDIEKFKDYIHCQAME